MDPVFLSRIQFALTSMFHYIYPPLSIGLGLLLVIMEGLYLKTKKNLYKEMTKFWTKVFSLTFALGVATGLVQLFGFGTNWSRYSRFVGDVFGSALGAEGIFAFFLESGFLGLMLFGWDRVKPSIHYLATVCVCLGAHFSALWIVIANSWMQTPTAYKIVEDGLYKRAVVTDFWGMIFNPSSMDRIIHVILGCWLSGIFLVISVSAYYLLKKKHLPFAKMGIKIGLFSASIVLLLQLWSADSTARGVAYHQPSKFAAMEGVYQTTPSTPITAFGWVDEKTQQVKGVQIPGLLSFFVYRDFTTPIRGLDTIPKDEWPPVSVVFQSYHVMVAMWAIMFFLTFFGFFLLKKEKLQKNRLLLWGLVLSVLCPQIANQVGWMTAEIGRQPWVVYGLLKTVEATSPYIEGKQVFSSILLLLGIYTLLFCLFIFLLDRKIKHGPEKEGDDALYHDPFTKKKTSLESV